ncbi:ATP-binding protein [Stenotrophomonas sp. TWI1183]|uniref:hybrid sensor histidine kinase/response regulator n=1 Tax=Stenotrophomonas sp. TWI1183 TaxID=3136799 RepID=UPI003207D825
MPVESTPVRLLARRSLWLHSLLVGTIAVATIQAGLLLSSSLQLLREEQQKVDFHFKRLSGALHEQERFMARWQGHQLDPADSKRPTPRFLDASPYPAAFSPFSVVSSTGSPPSPAATELGRAFSGFYGSFWSDSRYPSPRCLLLDGTGTMAALVPHALPISGSDNTADPTLRRMMGIIHAEASITSPQNGGMGWHRRDLADGSRWLLSVMRSPQDAALWANGGTPAISCMLDVSRIDDHQQVLGEPIYDRLSILAPDGRLLYGPEVDGGGGQSRHYSAGSITYRMRDAEGWQAVYQVGWARVLLHQRWPLIGGVIAAILLALGGIVALRSYRRSVLVPLRRNQERLQESEAFSRTVLEAAPIGLCLLRSSDGSVVLENALAREWLGARHDAPGWDGTWRQDALTLVKSGQSRTIPYRTPDGRHLLINTTQARYRGEPVTLCLFIDLTAQHEAEQVLQQARQEADQANRAKSLFLATMSHEIRTPLYGVLGTLELLGLTALDSQQRDYLSTIQHSSSTLMQLIGDILDVSKAEAGQLVLEPVLFSPAELTEEVLRSYAASATRKNLQLYACIDGDVPGHVHGDGARIRQVLNNLVSNAIKFTEAGRVVIRLQARDVSGRKATLAWQVADTGIGIEEHHQAHLFEAFYQANPGADAQRGTGLGLAISAQLVGLMGGQLRVVSDTGLGSSFSFELELDRPEDSSPSGRSADAEQRVYVRSPAGELVDTLCARLRKRGFLAQGLHRDPGMDTIPGTPLLEVPMNGPIGAWDGPHVVARTGGGDHPQQVNGVWLVSMHRLDAMVDALLLATGRPLPLQGEPSAKAFQPLHLSVLVAEDNPINQMILREQLERLGCHAVVASDGAEAFDYWTRRHFDVVITDLNMPHVDGYALAERLHGHGITAPIFGATANADPTERARCRSVGMADCLVKPIRLDDLYRHLSPLAVTGSSPDVLLVAPRMRTLFLETMRDDMAALARSQEIGDLQGVKHMLHRLRGALVIVSAEPLADESKRIEDRIDDGTSAEDCVPGIDAFIVRLECALAHLESTSVDPTDPP